MAAPYVATTPEGSEAATKIFQLIDRGHAQWTTYAKVLGNCYSDAYDLHKDAVDKIGKKYNLDNDTMYFVLSLIAVSLAGGVLGGVMAPWVAAVQAPSTAGALTDLWVSAAFRTGVRTAAAGGSSSAVQMATQKGIDLTKRTTAFVPQVADPSKFKGTMEAEVGLLFSLLRDKADTIIQTIDQNPKANDVGKIIEEFRKLDPIKYIPDTKQMPSSYDTTREIEIAMWIMWAIKRDLAYWDSRINYFKSMSQGSPGQMVGYGYSTGELRYLDPMVDRLVTLKIWEVCSDVVVGNGIDFLRRRGDPSLIVSTGRVVNFHKMQTHAPYVGRFFLRRMALMLGKPQDALNKLAQIPPEFAGKVL